MVLGIINLVEIQAKQGGHMWVLYVNTALKEELKLLHVCLSLWIPTDGQIRVKRLNHFHSSAFHNQKPPCSYPEGSQNRIELVV